MLCRRRRALPDLTLKASAVAASPARSEVKQLNEYHATLMKLRLEGGLDGIELGPVLGQGSFGRVYKGTELKSNPEIHAPA